MTSAPDPAPVPTSRQLQLDTLTTSYVLSLTGDGSGLELDQWGERTTRPAESRAVRGRLPSFETATERGTTEIATSGPRVGGFCELVVRYPTGVNGTRWTHVGADPQVRSTSDGGVEGDALDVTLVDETGVLELSLHVRTSHAHDVVRRWVDVRNVSADVTVELARCFSAGWSLPVGPGARIDYLAGAWGREFIGQRLELPVGDFSIGSRRGVTSHHFSPVVTVGGAGAPDTDPAYGVALAWSGSWRLNVEAGQDSWVRVSAGVDDQDTVITLGPGEQFVAPESHGVFSAAGTEGVTHAWHAYQRLVLARDLSPAHRPVLYNSWYATEFDVRPDHQGQLADVAADLGAELFVVDDGWFQGRTTDHAGLGDWWPDRERFPDGLQPLVDAVTARGLRFGIWVEPEAVNPDSDLYRAHPDWVYRAGGRPLTLSRNQLVLDFGRAEVVAWAKDMLRSLLDAYPISYLKWDMNRPITDGGRPGDPHGREWSIQHARGYHAVMDTLRAEYPHVTVEACAGGGGRIDHAVLGVADVVWPSDETGPRDRLQIQHGFLSAYPPSVMSSWVTDELGHRDRLPMSLGYRFIVAMAGVLGIGADLTTFDADERAVATRMVALYKEIRGVVHTGTVHRHGAPAEPGYAVEYDAVDQVVVLVYDTRRDRSHDPVRVRPHSLAADADYRLESTGAVVSGATARAAGIEVPFAYAVDADVLVLTRLR